MSYISVLPCGHVLNSFECEMVIKESDLIVRLNGSPLITQIDEQIKNQNLTCPNCNGTINEMVPTGNFPLSTTLLSKVKIDSFTIEIKRTSSSQETMYDVVTFKTVDLINIEKRGKNSTDHGLTYRQLAEIANDKKGLTSMIGPVLGRVFYTLPTSWKAKVYISGIKRALQKGFPVGDWILSNQEGRTIGTFGLTKVDPEKLDFNQDPITRPLIHLNMYNISVILHSNFQRRGVLTKIIEHLYDQLIKLRVDIDAFFIMTRPENTAVNILARRLNFEFIKEIDVKSERLLPWAKSNTIKCNIYLKRLH